jgi:hypothetical protein
VVRLAVVLVVPLHFPPIWTAVAWVRGARADVGERFLHAWWIVVVATFTATYGKREVYLLPANPAIAILAGRIMAGATPAPGAPRLFGVVPIPERLRRRSGLPARALLVVLIVCLDATVLTAGGMHRLHRNGTRSLVPFANAVAAAVPPDAALYAGRDVAGSDVQVLSYRLRRPIAHVPIVPAPDVDAASWYVARAPADHALASGIRVVAQSTRRGTNLALVTVSR